MIAGALRMTGAAAAASLYAGCSFATPVSQPMPLAMPAQRASLPAANNGSFLYVGSNTNLSEYRLGETSPVRTVQSPLGNNALAMDARGHLFTSNRGISWGTLTVYRSRDLHVLRTFQGQEMATVAADRSGYLYAGACSSFISVFSPTAKRGPTHLIRQGAGSVCALVFDSARNLYAANSDGHSVSVYAPGHRPGVMKFVRGIENGVGHPNQLAVDRTGNLYVSDCLSCWYSSPTKPDWISIYAPGSSSPRLKIRNAIDGPTALAVDAKGRLYVANIPDAPKSSQPGWVSVYAPGSTKPLRTITDGVYYPAALAIDPSDRLYVANAPANTVTVYSAGGAKLLYTIARGVSYPLALAIGSP